MLNFSRKKLVAMVYKVAATLGHCLHASFVPSTGVFSSLMLRFFLLSVKIEADLHPPAFRGHQPEPQFTHPCDRHHT